MTLKGVWTLIGGEARDNTDAFVVGRWAFGSPNFLRFIAIVVVESYIGELAPGELADGAGRAELYKQIAKTSYPNAIDGGSFTQYISTVSDEFVKDRKIYILIGNTAIGYPAQCPND